jgi:WD40 repeat protein
MNTLSATSGVKMRRYFYLIISARLAAAILLTGNTGSPSSVQAQSATVAGQIVAWQPTENGLLAIGSRESENISIYDSQFNLITALSLDTGFFAFDMSWSPDGTRLAVSSQRVGRGMIYVWEQIQPNTFMHQASVDLTDRASKPVVAWSADSTRIAGIADTRVEIWDADTGQLIQRIGTPTGAEQTGNATDIAWSPDGTRIAIGTNGNFVHVIDASTYQLLTSITVSNEFDVDAVIWSPDNSQLIAARANIIFTFDATTYEPVISVDNGEFFTDLVAWQGNYLAVAGSQPEIIVWDTTTWSIVETITTTDLAIVSIAWKPNSTILAYGGYTTSTTTLEEVVSTSCDPATTITNGDTAALISAITSANGTPEPDTICLAENGTYTFSTEHSGSNALPEITSEITIEGNNATLARDVAAPVSASLKSETQVI